MKQTILTAIVLVAATLVHAQNIDSILAQPQTIELSISTPQPRMKEAFEISLDMNHLRANIFRSLYGKVELADPLENSNDAQLMMKVTALKKGKNEIGPLKFTVDKTVYTTNKIVYEVIDPLPNTDRGLWFRKVNTSDSTFCIIIEQRIPAKEKTTNTSANSFSITTEPEYTAIAKFKDSYSIAGLSGLNARTSTNFGNVEINGETRQFMYGFSVYYFTILDKKAKIKITADKLEQLPAGYQFEDIVVQ